MDVQNREVFLTLQNKAASRSASRTDSTFLICSDKEEDQMMMSSR